MTDDGIFPGRQFPHAGYRPCRSLGPVLFADTAHTIFAVVIGVFDTINLEKSQFGKVGAVQFAAGGAASQGIDVEIAKGGSVRLLADPEAVHNH